MGEQVKEDIEIKLACSDEMNQYFAELKKKAEHGYRLASEARGKGKDPTFEPEIIMTEDLAARVEGLVGPKGIAKRIREVAAEVPSREMLSLRIAQELAKDMSVNNKQQAVDQAVRTGLAILTEGVLVAPIEGIAKVEIEKNTDGSEFISLFFAGPIRSAGGTGQAMSVLIADMVRRAIGLDRYKPTSAEIERMKEEMSLYHRRMHLQYKPKPEEIELIVNSCPICVDGEGTEDEEVSGYRNIARIKTTRIRGGACLVIAEGLCLKAAKLLKIVKQLEIDGWEFIESIANRILKKDDDQQKPKETGISIRNKENTENKELLENIESSDVNENQTENYDIQVDDIYTDDELIEDEDESYEEEDVIEDDEVMEDDEYPEDENVESVGKIKIKSNEKYMRDSLAGRPIFSNPSQIGGFRLRYGRARTTGLTALAMNPVTMSG